MNLALLARWRRMLPEPVRRRQSAVGLPATSIEPEPVPAWRSPARPSIRMEPEPVWALTSLELARARWSEPEPDPAETWPAIPLTSRGPEPVCAVRVVERGVVTS